MFLLICLLLLGYFSNRVDGEEGVRLTFRVYFNNTSLLCMKTVNSRKERLLNYLDMAAAEVRL